MEHFRYVNNQLNCERVSIERVARKVGTPFYLYSHAALIDRFDAYDKAFASLPHVICFAMKANSNLAVLRAIAQRGGGVDIVTGGELYRARLALVPPKKIVFSGVGKSEEEIAYALKTGILMFNVESADELEAINRVARRLKKKAPVAIRVNPNIDPKTHPYISTGLKKSKFGVRVPDALKLYAAASRFRNIKFTGLSCHIGSQITQLGPFEETVDKLSTIVKRLRAMDISVDYLDIGGGLGICYESEQPPSPAMYGKTLVKALRQLGVTVILEPGRSIAGNAGIFVSKVLYNKVQSGKRFVVVDGAMNDLMRPSLYGSYHEIRAVRKRSGKKYRSDIVGPICESGDFLAQDRPLPTLKSGDLIAVLSAGAYGFTMASNYNARPRVAEVMVHGREFHVVREREKYRDLPHGEHVPKFLV